MDYIDPKKITYLPNTAGCFNSKEALRTLRLAREIGGWKLVKLEVLGEAPVLGYQKDNHVLFYPNPVQGGMIKFSDTTDEIEILSLTGKSIFSDRSKKRNLDVSFLKAGTYLLKYRAREIESIQRMIIEE